MCMRIKSCVASHAVPCRAMCISLLLPTLMLACLQLSALEQKQLEKEKRKAMLAET